MDYVTCTISKFLLEWSFLYEHLYVGSILGEKSHKKGTINWFWQPLSLNPKCSADHSTVSMSISLIYRQYSSYVIPDLIYYYYTHDHSRSEFIRIILYSDYFFFIFTQFFSNNFFSAKTHVFCKSCINSDPYKALLFELKRHCPDRHSETKNMLHRVNNWW